MNRCKKLAALLPEDVDAVLIESGCNRRYFTDLSSSAGSLIITKDKAYFLIDFRYIEIARKTVTDAEVILQEKPHEQTAEILRRHRVRTLSVETSYMTVGARRALAERLDGVTVLEDGRVDAEILRMRSVKSAEELRRIMKAQSITDACFLEMLDFVAPGRTEREIAAYLEYTLKRKGAEGLAFETIAVAGPNSALPHGVPGERPVQRGDFLTMDFGARYAGYCSDMTRTVAVGEPTDEMRKVYQTVLDAQLRGIAAARTGVSCRAVDEACRNRIYGEGYEGCFGHGTGHSVGIEIHESPGFSPLSPRDSLCENGLVVTVEPGIYLEGKFGVRIEDMITFREDETIDLTNSRKELVVL